MDKDRHTLDVFCRKIAKLGMNIFPLAMDGNDKDISWRTLENGTHFPIKEGENVKEAAEKFIARKRQERSVAVKSEKGFSHIETGSSAPISGAKPSGSGKINSGTKTSGGGSAGSESLPEVMSRDGKPISYQRTGSGKEYVDKLTAAKQSRVDYCREKNLPIDAWRVDVHDPEDYDKNTKMFHTKHGSVIAVCQVTDDDHTKGDIISVCGRAGAERGSDLLKLAVANGGDRLDSFDGNHDFYVRNGFEPVSWVKFSDEYAPDEWKALNPGFKPGMPDDKLKVPREDVIFYCYTGRKTDESAADFKRRIAASESYDDAKNVRNAAMEKGE